MPEPGRAIVAQELASGGSALPWTDPLGFAKRALTQARADLSAAAQLTGPVFFDRGLIDAAVALGDAGGPAYAETLGPARIYATPVFVAPPWPDIFTQDKERRHSFDDAVAEHVRITQALTDLGYATVTLPKNSPQGRVRFVLSHLKLIPQPTR